MLAVWMRTFVRVNYLSCADTEFCYVYKEVQKSLSGISIYVRCLVQVQTDFKEPICMCSRIKNNGQNKNHP